MSDDEDGPETGPGLIPGTVYASRGRGSDVSVFVNPWGALECGGCVLRHPDDPQRAAVFSSPEEMMEHLTVHRALLGDLFPEELLPALAATPPEPGR